MKFTVAAPFVALLTALILALLTLLAGINPGFMPDAYIVRIAEKNITTPDGPGSNRTALFGTDKGRQSGSPTGQPGDHSTGQAGNHPKTPDRANVSSPTRGPVPVTETTSSSPRRASTEHNPLITDTTPEHVYIVGQDEVKRVKPGDNAQITFPTMDAMPPAGANDHVLVNARSGPRNHSSFSATDAHASIKPYSLYFLTNCQWSFKDKAENCTKPWDFVKYTLEGRLVGGGPSGSSQAENDDEELDKLTAKAKMLIHNRKAFSKVHLTGCILVGLSLICTAISFFILPALGQWISVGNLALATLATIFLLIGSIFTAVLAKEMRKFFEDEKDYTEFVARPGGKLQALV